MGGPRPGARTQPVAGPSRPGIFHRLPAGQTEVTRAWGGGRQAQACPRGSGPPPVHVRVCGPSPAICCRPFSCPSLRPPLQPSAASPSPAPSMSESAAPLQPSVAGPSPVSSATFYCTRPVSSPLDPPAPVVYSDSPFLLVVRDVGRPGHRVQLMARAKRIGSSLILG